MALTKTVTKALPQNDDEVAFHLIITDDKHPTLGEGTHTVIDMDYTESYSTGKIVEARTAIAKQMQVDINNYKNIKDFCNNAAYENARSIIENALDVSE